MSPAIVDSRVCHEPIKTMSTANSNALKRIAEDCCHCLSISSVLRRRCWMSAEIPAERPWPWLFRERSTREQSRASIRIATH